ncbi:MAG: 2-phospho-L-lactate transferase CofD family protein [Caulobacteraceae bacterium]
MAATPHSSGELRVALFCGGRGSATIISALLRRPEIDLTLIVNAYDDGLSTGALRDFIPGMLGPSDFRKNLTYLIGLYSNGQYALRNLIEYRLPREITLQGIERLWQFSRLNHPQLIDQPIRSWFEQLPATVSAHARALLAVFFAYAQDAPAPFNYADCSLGNLLFAGAYLKNRRNFNDAAAEIGELVDARASLVNISEGSNRVLVGLKEDGTYLSSEARIVGVQSTSPIRQLYFLDAPLTAEEQSALDRADISAKDDILASLSSVPELSSAAETALREADMIVFGPGTQHSSLLPSYKIAGSALASAPAQVKAFVANLDVDHDIQGLTAGNLVDRVHVYAGASAAEEPLITHILTNQDDVGGRLPAGGLVASDYRGAEVVRGEFATPYRPHVHNGSAVVDCLLSLWAKRSPGPAARSIEVYASIINRSVGAAEVVEEFLETDWSTVPAAAHLILNRTSPPEFDLPASAPVACIQNDSEFPEARYFATWLAEGSSDYLVLLTGDGAYDFHDVLSAIRLMEQHQTLGAIFGSRTQSRSQFIASVQAAYGEHRALYQIAKAAAFMLSMLLYLRSGVIFSDPLSGLRVFRRERVSHLSAAFERIRAPTPVGITRMLVRSGVEIAELPIQYRTFSGFTDPRWRARRGLRNVMDLLFH